MPDFKKFDHQVILANSRLDISEHLTILENQGYELLDVVVNPNDPNLGSHYLLFFKRSLK